MPAAASALSSTHAPCTGHQPPVQRRQCHCCTVLLSCTMTRSCRCHRTARASTSRSRSRPCRAWTTGSRGPFTLGGGCSRAGIDGRSHYAGLIKSHAERSCLADHVAHAIPVRHTRHALQGCASTVGQTLGCSFAKQRRRGPAAQTRSGSCARTHSLAARGRPRVGEHAHAQGERKRRTWSMMGPQSSSAVA